MARQPSRSKVLGEQINAYLKRFEADKDGINKVHSGDPKIGLRPYYNANAGAVGGRVQVVYISYQGRCSLTVEQAEIYLKWLDAGNVGRHYEAEKEAEKEAERQRSRDPLPAVPADDAEAAPAPASGPTPVSPVSPELLAKMERSVRDLVAFLRVAEQDTGRKFSLFAGGGGLHLLDVERDEGLLNSHGVRGRLYEKGGSIIRTLTQRNGDFEGGDF